MLCISDGTTYFVKDCVWRIIICSKNFSGWHEAVKRMSDCWPQVWYIVWCQWWHDQDYNLSGFGASPVWAPGQLSWLSWPTSPPPPPSSILHLSLVSCCLPLSFLAAWFHSYVIWKGQLVSGVHTTYSENIQYRAVMPCLQSGSFLDLDVNT